ncbi:MAG: glycosyltransferase family 2 protein [Candidatus Omnitrophota bacterium]
MPNIQLSVVVPVYNESGTIEKVIERINAVDIDKEIIVIDNCSNDGTQDVLQRILKTGAFNNVRVIYHSCNKGKGTSVREGIQESKGEIVVIQDADFEYNPQEYHLLIAPILAHRADVVLGARFMKGYAGIVTHRLGNKLLTAFLNLLFASSLNDYATCYKMARRQVFLDLDLRSSSFEIEAEIICKALKKKLRIEEVAISYFPRSYAEGKKIRWSDGVAAFYNILKYRLTRG